MKEEIAKLQSEVVELTRLMKEKSDKGYDSEVKSLSDQLIELQKEVKAANERKMQFDAGYGKPEKVNKKELQTKCDELFIASALLTRKDGSLDKAAFDAIKEAPEYRDVVKDAGISTTSASTLQSSASGDGGEFIPTGFSAQLLEEIWLKLEIANLFQRFTMPNATYHFPLVTDRLTARKATEATAITKDSFTTDEIIFTAKKIMANVDFSDELDQDSILAVLPLVRRKIIEAFALGQEQIVLNGDTTSGATNLNGDLTSTPEDVRLTVKGLRALANSGDKISFASGGFSADNLRALRSGMKKYGKSPSDLVYIMSMKDYNTALGFTGYQALYQYAGAVTTTGELGRIDNIPIIVTELLPSTGDGTTAGVNTTGVKDATAANNTKNICGLVNKNAYMWGDRKQFGLETFRNPYTQTLSLIGSQRLDFQKVLPATDPTAVFGINY